MDEQRSDTTENNGKKPGGVTGKGFVKGDPRINRKGRPKSFDAFRKLCQSVMDEPATTPDGKPIIKEVNGKKHIVTNAEMFAESWMKSKDRKGFAEFAYGKPREEIDLTSGGKPIEPKAENDERFNRAISSLADAIRESVPGTGAKAGGDVVSTE